MVHTATSTAEDLSSSVGVAWEAHNGKMLAGVRWDGWTQQDLQVICIFLEIYAINQEMIFLVIYICTICICTFAGHCSVYGPSCVVCGVRSFSSRSASLWRWVAGFDTMECSGQKVQIGRGITSFFECRKPLCIGQLWVTLNVMGMHYGF